MVWLLLLLLLRPRSIASRRASLSYKAIVFSTRTYTIRWSSKVRSGRLQSVPLLLRHFTLPTSIFIERRCTERLRLKMTRRSLHLLRPPTIVQWHLMLGSSILVAGMGRSKVCRTRIGVRGLNVPLVRAASTPMCVSIAAATRVTVAMIASTAWILSTSATTTQPCTTRTTRSRVSRRHRVLTVSPQSRRTAASRRSCRL